MQHPCGIRFLINTELSQDVECNYFTSVLKFEILCPQQSSLFSQKEDSNVPCVPLAVQVQGLCHGSLRTGIKPQAQVLLIVNSIAGPCSAQINHLR